VLSECARHHAFLLNHTTEVLLEGINIHKLSGRIRVFLSKEHHIIKVNLSGLLRLEISDYACEYLNLHMIWRLHAGPFGHLSGKE